MRSAFRQTEEFFLVAEGAYRDLVFEGEIKLPEGPITRAVDKTFCPGGIGFGTFDDSGNVGDAMIWSVTERRHNWLVLGL